MLSECTGPGQCTEAVATRVRHNHDINMNFGKQSAHDRNSQGDVQLGSLVNLALVASLDVPFDVINQHGPPEVPQQAHPD